MPNANALIRFAKATARPSVDVVRRLGSVARVSNGSYSAEFRALPLLLVLYEWECPCPCGCGLRLRRRLYTCPTPPSRMSRTRSMRGTGRSFPCFIASTDANESSLSMSFTASPIAQSSIMNGFNSEGHMDRRSGVPMTPRMAGSPFS